MKSTVKIFRLFVKLLKITKLKKIIKGYPVQTKRTHILYNFKTYSNLTSYTSF